MRQESEERLAWGGILLAVLAVVVFVTASLPV